jgi:hypothetical protein
MSALMSASAYFRLLPPRLATCSSIASFTVLLCAALILEDICAAPLCLPVFTWRTSVSSRQAVFLLLVSGNLIRLDMLEAVDGAAALKWVALRDSAGRYLVKTSRKRCMTWGRNGRLWGARGGRSFRCTPGDGGRGAGGERGGL